MKDMLVRIDRVVSLAFAMMLLGMALFLANDPHGFFRILELPISRIQDGMAFHWVSVWTHDRGSPFTLQGLAVAFFAGYVAGGFLTTAIARIPARESAMARALAWAELGYEQAATAELQIPGIGGEPPSCIHCHAPIPVRLQTPVLAWLWLRGKAACCGQPVPLRYPLVEALTPVLFTVIAWRFGHDPILPALCIFCAGLIVLAFIDLDHLVLPDVIVLPLLWYGLAVNLNGGIVPPGQAVAGAIAGYLFFRIFRDAYFRLAGRTGLGLGDCKLAAAIGAWCGPLGLLHATVMALGTMVLVQVLLIASGRLTGLTSDVKMPLGPWLACGIISQILFPGVVPEFLSLLL